MRPNTYNPDCDFDPDQRDLDASIEERNKTEPDGTAPGYVNAEKPAPHRFSKKFDQNTGKPFNFCMVCGRKEEVLFEPKCSECGHSEHKFLCLHTIELSNREHDVCDCQSFSPAEPDATDEDFKIEPISQHTLKVPVQYKGQAEPLDFTEPDATARAYENSALYEFELYLHENGQALRIPDAIPGSVMVAAEKFAEQYAAKQIERQTPAIIERFVEEVEKKVNIDGLDRRADDAGRIWRLLKKGSGEIK